MKSMIAFIVTMVGLSALFAAFPTKAADEIYITMCNEEITQWYLRDSNGIEVLASHSAILSSMPMKAFLLEMQSKKPLIFVRDPCKVPERYDAYGEHGLIIEQEEEENVEQQ